MHKAETQSRLYCVHYVPSNIDCAECRSTQTDYLNRPLYAPVYVPLPNLPAALDNSRLKLPKAFYVPLNEKSSNQKQNNASASYLSSDDCVEIQTKDGIVRVPQSLLVHRSYMNESAANKNVSSPRNSTCHPQQAFPGDFQNHAHRFTRSFSWKTKPEEPPYAQMQPLPKLIKRPGYIEMCCKNICWPTHQLCLCCGRNTAESCRKWSKSTGEYDYIDACWSSCALCSDDAYKILNTPVVYHDKIIDPELLLPLDAELLYYSIQSAKRQQEKQQQSQSMFIPEQTTENHQDDIVPFTAGKNDFSQLQSILKNQESTTKSELFNPPSIVLDEPKQPDKVDRSKSTKKKTKKTNKKKSSKKKKPTKKSNRSKTRAKKKSSRSKTPTKKKSSRSRSRSRRKSKSKS